MYDTTLLKVEMEQKLAHIVEEMEGEPAEALGILFQLSEEDFPGDMDH